MDLSKVKDVVFIKEDILVKIRWLKTFSEDEKQEKKKIKDAILTKYQGKLVTDFGSKDNRCNTLAQKTIIICQ